MTKCDCCREGNSLAMAEFLLGLSDDMFSNQVKLTLCKKCVDVFYQLVHTRRQLEEKEVSMTD